ncbi:MAG: anthranilate synthase component I [Pseudomonadota bacterium]
MSKYSKQVTFEEFEQHFLASKTQIIWKWIPADLETPVSAFLKLTGEAPYSFLLESVEGGATLGRYSAIGFDPDLIWKHENGVTYSGHNVDERDPVTSLRAHLTESHIDVVDDSLPPMASSGLFGFMGYDCIRWIEDIPNSNPDDLDIPESIMIRPEQMVIFDNVQNMMCLATPVRSHVNNSDKEAAKAYKEANDLIDQIERQLSEPLNKLLINRKSEFKDAPLQKSNMSRQQFHDKVNKAVEDIHAGEIFQAVISQRFSMDFDLPPFTLYRSLRRLNPSPFLFFFNFEGFALVGSSPEILVRLRDNIMTVRPIAGTRKRGANALEDKELATELLSDAKERSEHLMLLDLGRNDVGRVAKEASVKVTEQFEIELYSHVMHIVSNVEGELRDDKDSLDALFAGFPAGTVSGAPKIRAMEIIDDLEPTRRSFYSGCVGYLNGNGELDTCIALRTALVKDGTVYVQAGGGVVADSDPEFEYQESQNKARAILQAAQDVLELSRN